MTDALALALAAVEKLFQTLVSLLLVNTPVEQKAGQGRFPV
jgi:hypothetical protein